jgi:hypothetical protein
MTLKQKLVAVLLAGAGVIGGAVAAVGEDRGPSVLGNDYPTNARADYIFGCMQVTGQTRVDLDRCACSIDVIASVLPYKEYEEAETILAVRQRGGENVAFLFNPASREKVNTMKRAQIEGELRCF